MKKTLPILLALVSSCFHDNDDELANIYALLVSGPSGPCRPGTNDSYPADTRDVAGVSLELISRYESLRFWNDIDNDGATENAAFATSTNILFVANALDITLDMIDLSNPTQPGLIRQIDMKPYGSMINHVYYKNGVIAAANDGPSGMHPGQLVFFNGYGRYLGKTRTGVQPDNVAISPDGCYAMTANTGEPMADLSVVPEGSVTIVNLSQGFKNLQDRTVNLTFADYNIDNIHPDVRLDLYHASRLLPDVADVSVAQDIEPEYVAINQDSNRAFVPLQSNNAWAIIDIPNRQIVDIVPMGFKDWSSSGIWSGNGIHSSDTNIDNQNYVPRYQGTGITALDGQPLIQAMFQPDGISSYRVDGVDYIVTGNEGDWRRFESAEQLANGDPVKLTFENRVRFKHVRDATRMNPTSNLGCARVHDPSSFGGFDPEPDSAFGRMRVSKFGRDLVGDGCIDQFYSFGARSVSIWNASGELIWDSGSIIEDTIRMQYNEFLGSTHNRVDRGSRNDDKGPEVEHAVVGKVGNRFYSFIVNERVGGIFVFDITNPVSPSFVEFTLNRSPRPNSEAETKLEVELGIAVDLGPEGIIFVHALQSPNGKDLVITTNEVSGTIAIYQINVSEN